MVMDSPFNRLAVIARYGLNYQYKLVYNGSDKSRIFLNFDWVVLRAKHMLVQRDPTDMNGQFTYGSQLSSNSLAVDSHR